MLFPVWQYLVDKQERRQRVSHVLLGACPTLKLALPCSITIRSHETRARFSFEKVLYGRQLYWLRKLCTTAGHRKVPMRYVRLERRPFKIALARGPVVGPRLVHSRVLEV